MKWNSDVSQVSRSALSFPIAALNSLNSLITKIKTKNLVFLATAGQVDGRYILTPVPSLFRFDQRASRLNVHSTPNLHIDVVFMESLPSEWVAPETLALDICASCQQLTLSATPLNVAKNELREAQGLSSSASETDKY